MANDSTEMLTEQDLLAEINPLYPYEIQNRFSVADSVCGETITLDFYIGSFHLGDAQLILSEDKQRLRWIEFYPFREVDAEEFQRKGIGTLAHVEGLVQLIKEYRLSPDCKISHAPSFVSSERKAHLQKIGLLSAISEEGMPLAEYVSASIAYAQKREFDFEESQSYF